MDRPTWIDVDGKRLRLHSIATNPTGYSSSQLGTTSQQATEIVNVMEKMNDYEWLLRKHGALTECCQKGLVFVLNDYANNRLLPDNFHFINRRRVYLSGGQSFVYACSCDGKTIDRLHAMAETISGTFADIETAFPRCNHISAAVPIINEYDDFVGITDPDLFDHCYAESEEHDMPITVHRFNATHAIVCLPDNCYGVVQQQSGVVRCCTCPRNMLHCVHVAGFQNSMEEVTEEEKDGYRLEEDVAENSSSHITSQIPLQLPQTVCAALRTGVEAMTVVQANPICSICLHETDVKNKSTVSLFTMRNVIEVTMISCTCSRCGITKFYDGISDGVVNVENKYLVGLDVFRLYYNLFSQDGTTLYAFHKSWSSMMVHDFDIHSFLKMMPYHKYTHSWYHYISRLSAPTEAMALSCIECGDSPSIVICDGTALSVQRRFWKSSGKGKTGAFQPNLSLIELQYIADVDSRNIVTKFLGGMHIENTCHDLHQYPEVLKLLLYIQQSSNAVARKNVYKNFLHALSTKFPFAQLLPTDLDRLRTICEKTKNDGDEHISADPATLQWLQEDCPILSCIILKEGLCVEFCNVLLSMLEKLHQTACASRLLPPIEDPVQCQDAEDNICMLPSLPQVRHRGCFLADKKSARMCTKRFQSYRHTLMPGIFLIYCNHEVTNGLC